MTWTHAVVGCTNCTGLWIITPDPETATCPRCGTRHNSDQLRKLATTTSQTHARELRGRLLAEQHNLTPDTIEDTAYLTNEPELENTQTTHTTSENAQNLSKPELLEHTIHTLETPTKPTIIDAMASHGIDEEETSTLLKKLRHDGSIIKQHDQYRTT